MSPINNICIPNVHGTPVAMVFNYYLHFAECVYAFLINKVST
jgi:hypothetical protein